MALGAVSQASSSTAGIDSLGLNLQSLLQLILTQLTYQDPLKPVDNFQFMSQLAQFTSLEQTRQLADKVDNLLLVQASTQAIGLLGRQVDLTAQAGAKPDSGVVQAVSFQSGQPKITLKTSDGRVITDVSTSQVSTVR